MMSVVIAALLIRAGGRVDFSRDEWTAAIEHEGSMWIHRDDEESKVEVWLMPKTVKT